MTDKRFCERCKKWVHVVVNAEKSKKKRESSTEQVRKWRAANPERAKQYNRDYLRMWRAKQ